MKTIPLTKGKHAIVDDCDFLALSRFKWKLGKGYACRNVRKRGGAGWGCVRMHRVVAGTPDGMETDHRDGNRLNNQRANLRACTKAENLRNTGPQRNNLLGIKGVSRTRYGFVARIHIGRACRHLGTFPTAEDAGVAYASAAAQMHGEFAKASFPPAKS